MISLGCLSNVRAVDEQRASASTLIRLHLWSRFPGAGIHGRPQVEVDLVVTPLRMVYGKGGENSIN